MYTLSSDRFLCNVPFSAYAGWLKKSIKVVETRILLVVISRDGGGEVSNYLQSCCCPTTFPWSVLIYPKLIRPTACSIPLNPDINRIPKNIIQKYFTNHIKSLYVLVKHRAIQKLYSRTTLVHLFLEYVFLYCTTFQPILICNIFSWSVSKYKIKYLFAF